MNECEQIHPLLRGYLAEDLSARDRRLVARHLNLCASARRELDRLRSGALKTPVEPAEAPSEPWDLKILRWLFKTSKPAARPIPGRSRKSRPVEELEMPLEKKSSPLKPIVWIIVFFAVLALLTRFIQNAGQNSVVKGTKRWISKHGYHVFGVKPTLELVLDLSGLPSWNGGAAPVAGSFRGLITDIQHQKLYWQILQPGQPMPEVDFTQKSLAVIFLGGQASAGRAARFVRAENYTDKTILWYDEVASPSGTLAPRPWVIQVVPKPPQEPVLIQKVP